MRSCPLIRNQSSPSPICWPINPACRIIGRFTSACSTLKRQKENRGSTDIFVKRRCSSGAPVEKAFAATEDCPWRQGVVRGKVHDENAFVVGGVDGHAGLFGTADHVHALLNAFLLIYHGQQAGVDLPTETMRRFLNYGEKGGRALGFDRPSAKASSSGTYFSENSVGHLGFTGVSFWMDLDRRIIIVLLTNRIHPTRTNESIKAFRPVLHDSIMRNLLKAENSQPVSTHK
ncbi:MAG: serine hydrolase [Deltaproteobacteria bacterium]